MDMGRGRSSRQHIPLSGTVVLDPGMARGSTVFIFKNGPDSREPFYIIDPERRDQRKVTQAAGVSGGKSGKLVA